MKEFMGFKTLDELKSMSKIRKHKVWKEGNNHKLLKVRS